MEAIQLTNTAEDLSEAIRSAGTIVDFHAGAWRGEVLDPRIGKIVSEATGSEAEAHRAYTSLLAGDTGKLKAIEQRQSAARRAFYAETLNFGFGRLLPNAKFASFIKEMEGKKQQVMAAVDDFVADYPTLVENAKVKLSEMGNGLRWPDPEDIRDRFYVRYDFYPVPSGSGFKGLPPSIIERLEQNAQSRIERNMHDAMADGAKRLRKYIGNVRERMQDEDAVFRNTLISNVERVVDLVEPLNVINDPTIAAVCEEARAICDFEPDDLRHSMSARKLAGDKAARAEELLREAGF